MHALACATPRRKGKPYMIIAFFIKFRHFSEAKLKIYNAHWAVFFLSGSPTIQKCSPTQNCSTTSVDTQNGPLKPPATYVFRVWCPQSTDSENWGHTRHVNQFQHAISQSCVNIGLLTLSGSSNLAARSNIRRFCYVPLFWVRPSASLKSTTLALCHTQNLKHLSARECRQHNRVGDKPNSQFSTSTEYWLAGNQI